MNGAMMLPEFDHEFALTRKTLVRIPEDQFDWKPHEKSYSLHALAAHLANIPQWVMITVNNEVFDMSTSYQQVVPKTKEGILARFEEGLAEARTLLEDTTAEQLRKMWSLIVGDRVALSLPRSAVLRSFVFNHNIHHRAQLGVYLRMLDVSVPATYGPSADER